MLLDDQLAGFLDVFGTKLWTVIQQISTYENRFQVEHECGAGVQQFADYHILKVFEQPDALQREGLRV